MPSEEVFKTDSTRSAIDGPLYTSGRWNFLGWEVKATMDEQEDKYRMYVDMLDKVAEDFTVTTSEGIEKSYQQSLARGRNLIDQEMRVEIEKETSAPAKVGIDFDAEKKKKIEAARTSATKRKAELAETAKKERDERLKRRKEEEEQEKGTHKDEYHWKARYKCWGIALNAYQDMYNANGTLRFFAGEELRHVRARDYLPPTTAYDKDKLIEEWANFEPNNPPLHHQLPNKLSELTLMTKPTALILVLGLPSFQRDLQKALQHHVWALYLVKQWAMHLQTRWLNLGSNCKVLIDDTFYTKDDYEFVKEKFTWTADTSIIEPQVMAIHDIMPKLNEKSLCESAFIITFNSDNPIRQIVADMVLYPPWPHDVLIPPAIVCAAAEVDQKPASSEWYNGDRNADTVTELLDHYNRCKIAEEKSGSKYYLHLAKHVGAPTPVGSSPPDSSKGKSPEVSGAAESPANLPAKSPAKSSGGSSGGSSTNLPTRATGKSKRT